MDIVLGILIPLFGTTLGAACVFFLKKEIKPKLQQSLLGFASGVMVAASIWSLILPAIEMSDFMGKLSFIPSSVGFALGIGFLLLMDKVLPKLHLEDKVAGAGNNKQQGAKGNQHKAELKEQENDSQEMTVSACSFTCTAYGECSSPRRAYCGKNYSKYDYTDSKQKSNHKSLKKTLMLVLAVTLHNIPEGMAVGVVFAGLLNADSEITLAGAYALAIGIGIQNFPEGAVISLPLRNEGTSRLRAFIYGTLSGIVEPIAAVITLLITQFIANILPYLLTFAAGAMFYVVIEELLPESEEGEHTHTGTIGFTLGFLVMMILDVALG